MNYNSTPLYIKLTFLTPKTIFLLPLLLMGMVGYAQQSALLDNQLTPLTTDILSGLTVTSSETCVLFVCDDDFSNKGNVIDQNISNPSVWTVLVSLGGSAWIEVEDGNAVGSEVYQGGSYAGFVLADNGLLSLLDNITISTYLNGQVQETVTSNDLLSLGLGLLTDQSRLGFFTDPTKDFDKIRLSANIPIGIAANVSVYYAEVMKFEDINTIPCNNEFTVIGRPDYPMYVDPDATGFFGGTVGTINNPDNAVDGDLQTAATINTTAAVGGSSVFSIKKGINTDPFSSGQFVGMEIGFPASLLDLSLLGNLTIQTYNGGTGTSDILTGDNLALSINLLEGSQRAQVGMYVENEFDEIRLTISSGIGLLNQFQIYGMVIKCFQEGSPPPCNNQYTIVNDSNDPYFIDGTTTGISGTVGANNSIENTANILDGDDNTYATVNQLLGLNSIATIGIKKALSPVSDGIFIGFDIENTASILDLQVLNGITISTFLNGIPQESTSGGNLAIGATLLAGSDRQTLGFVTTKDFDEVVLTLNGNLAEVTLGTTRVYSLVLKCFAEGPALACNTNTYMTESTYPYYINMANTGVDGILGVNNQISDLSNLLDDETDNFASITQTASSGTATIAIQKALAPVPSGTYVAFDLDNPNLLGAELFNGLTVATYLNGALVESVSSADLISVSTSILTGTGRQKVGFIAGSAFDEVRLSVNANLIGLNLGTTRVYGLVLQEFCPGPALECNELSILYGGPSGHPVIVNGQRTGVDGVACAGCQINNPDNAIDNNPNTAASISLVGGVGASADFSVLNALDTYQAGTFAGFDIETTNLVGADVLGDFTLTTYLDGVQQEQVTIPSAVLAASSSIVNDGREVVGFVTSADFDEIQLSMAKLLAVDVGSVNIYSTIVQRGCAGTLDCAQAYQWLSPDFPLVVEGPHTGVDGLAGVLGEVIDPWNLINQNTADYAVLVAPVNVASPSSISIKDQVSEYPTGTTVGFTVRSVNSLLQLDLLEAITITTYNNGNFVESSSGTNLINLDLLVPLLGTGGTAYNVGFVTSAPFDEVQISLTSLLSAVNILNVYSPFVDMRTAVDANGNPLCPQISLAPDFNATFINVPVDGNVNTNDGVPSGTTYGTPMAEAGNEGGGMITMNTDGTYTFEASIPGTYHYQVPVCVPDQSPPCPTTRLTITVIDNEDMTTNPPVANTDYGTLLSNSSITVATLANDAPGYPEANLVPGSVNITTPPVNGSTSINPGNGNITYTPNTGFVGKDSLMYQVCDDSSPALCASAWQIFTVIPEGSPNTTTAVDDYIFIPVGMEGTGNVAINDSDAEGNTQTVTSQNTTIPGVGTFVLSPTGDYTFTPEPGFSGPVDIVYTTCDNGTPQACASATLHVLVLQEGPNYQPTISLNRTAITAPNADISFTIRVFEKNNISAFPGSNLISVRVNKDSRISITWDPNLMGQFGSNPFNQVDNNLWVFDDSHPAFYSWTYVGSSGGSSVFPASGSYRLGVHAQYIDPAETSGTTSISVFIPFNNVGGEVSFEDNQDTEILSIQTITE